MENLHENVLSCLKLHNSTKTLLYFLRLVPPLTPPPLHHNGKKSIGLVLPPSPHYIIITDVYTYMYNSHFTSPIPPVFPSGAAGGGASLPPLPLRKDGLRVHRQRLHPSLPAAGDADDSWGRKGQKCYYPQNFPLILVPTFIPNRIIMVKGLP